MAVKYGDGSFHDLVQIVTGDCNVVIAQNAWLTGHNWQEARLTGCTIDRTYGGQSLATVVVAVVVAAAVVAGLVVADASLMWWSAAHSEKAGKFFMHP